ncbi:MAG: hypothetical protein ACR2HF_02600 [Methylococcaceae bacterium]
MKKLVVTILVLLVLIFGGEMLTEIVHHILELMIHAVLIVLEYLELFTEESLEAVLVIAPREAQTLTAWLGMGLFLIILTLIVRKLLDVYQHFREWVGPWWEEQKTYAQDLYARLGWPVMALAALLIAAYFFLF